MSDSMQDGRKRNKRKYGGPHAGGKRRRGNRELEPGMQGILITCNMKERQCTAEAYSLLNEYGDQLYGPEQVTHTQLVKLSRALSSWIIWWNISTFRHNSQDKQTVGGDKYTFT